MDDNTTSALEDVWKRVVQKGCTLPQKIDEERIIEITFKHAQGFGYDFSELTHKLKILLIIY